METVLKDRLHAKIEPERRPESKNQGESGTLIAGYEESALIVPRRTAEPVGVGRFGTSQNQHPHYAGVIRRVQAPS